ncbi:uncharacterized protein [Porites lutea]|uniref:uncharacterized protein n=1 Tax=Porites lutea TaxID=51062 RepID=UPI003CC60CC5
MNQPFLTPILTLFLLNSPGKLPLTEASSLSYGEYNPLPTLISETSGAFPPGCKLYQNRKLLQCRNAQLNEIPGLDERWDVEIVDLSGNNISRFQFGNGYKNVKSIHLERNNITTVTENEILQLQHSLFLSLGRNPFKCDCNLEWLRRRLLGLHEHFPRLLHVETIKCATPANLEGRTLVNLSKDVLCGIKPEDKLLRQTTTASTPREKNSAELTAEAEVRNAEQTSIEKGRVAEIIGVTLGFAVIIVVMSVAFIIM